MKRLLSKQFSNLQAAVALSTHAQNASYIVVGALIYYYNIDSRAAIALSTVMHKTFFPLWLAHWDLIVLDLQTVIALSVSYKLWLQK